MTLIDTKEVYVLERIVTQTRFAKTELPRAKRVAAYARVSSGKDAMLHSLSAQVSYYSKLIQNPADGSTQAYMPMKL